MCPCKLMNETKILVHSSADIAQNPHFSRSFVYYIGLNYIPYTPGMLMNPLSITAQQFIDSMELYRTHGIKDDFFKLLQLTGHAPASSSEAGAVITATMELVKLWQD